MNALKASAGMLVSVCGCAALALATFVFVYYGHCEDTCDKPPRTTSGAVASAAPYLLGALVLLASASYLFMGAFPDRRPTLPRAVALGLLSAAAFESGLWGVGVGLGAVTNNDSAAPFLLGMGAFIAALLTASMLIARRIAPRA